MSSWQGPAVLNQRGIGELGLKGLLSVYCAVLRRVFCGDEYICFLNALSLTKAANS